MAYPVKWFSSNMQGAPGLGDTTDGALAALLKAVLVTGFGQLTITGLSWDATEGAAVATVQSGHKHLQDSVVLIEGVSPAVYNGEHRIKKVDTTRVWFELDGGNPGAAGSGAAMTIKVAPLGWTLTHESADGKVAIYRPTDISASGNVSLRVDNSAFTGWFGPSYHAYLAKIAMVEDVVDINTYTTIFEHRWPATKRFSDGRWDFIGDSQLFYFIPAYAAGNYQFVYTFGYIKSVRPGDRYHCIMNHYPSTNADEQGRWWDQPANNYTAWGNFFAALTNSNYRVLARPYSQLFGTTYWWNIGLFTRIGAGLNAPNAPDNGLYLSPDPLMVLENGSHMRGYMPGLVAPLSTVPTWDRKNFANLPAVPGKILRFLRVGFDESQYNPAITMISFDLTGPWR